MKILIDLNVVLDVVQERHPHHADSARILSRAREGEYIAVFADHAVTTLYYVLRKWKDRATAEQKVDWLLLNFEVGAADKAALRAARSLKLPDFEDAVVAAIAVGNACDRIVTRNAADFAGSPVPAITPASFLNLLDQRQRTAGS